MIRSKRAGSRQTCCDVNDAFEREREMGKASRRDAPWAPIEDITT